MNLEDLEYVYKGNPKALHSKKLNRTLYVGDVILRKDIEVGDWEVVEDGM